MSAATILRSRVAGVLVALVATTVLTAILAPIESRVGLLNEGLIFLLLTLLIASMWGWQVGVVAAVVTNLSLNFFFVPPLHTFSVDNPSNVFGLLVFLVVSVVGGSLLSTARASAAAARAHAAETQVLLRLTRTMIGQTEPSDALASLCREVVDALGASGAAVVSGSGASWRVQASAGPADAGRAPDAQERVMAERALTSGEISRLGTTGLGTTRRPRIVPPAGQWRLERRETGVAFVPLTIGSRTLGVLRVDGRMGETAFHDRPDRLLAAFASEAAQGVQRAELARAAAHADALVRADEMKSALMTSISHDLKTPLAGIKASVSSLLDGSVIWSDDDRRAFLETIDSQADRLNHVISDILDLNRLESGAIAPELRSLDVRPLLEEVRGRSALVAGSREMLVEAPAQLLVRADDSLITQALVNLVENAAKYSTPAGRIILRAERRGGQVLIIVEDVGPGITPADLPHVFERFYRAAEQSRRVKGSGLGLAIVKGFVTLCGGAVRVESAADGTRFIISLPVALPMRATA